LIGFSASVAKYAREKYPAKPCRPATYTPAAAPSVDYHFPGDQNSHAAPGFLWINTPRHDLVPSNVDYVESSDITASTPLYLTGSAICAAYNKQLAIDAPEQRSQSYGDRCRRQHGGHSVEVRACGNSALDSKYDFHF
jgi:hypothetical protein